MAVSATFVADFTSWKAAVDAATTQLRGFQTGATQVEASLKRVADSFSGRKILSEATLAVKAVADLGGVAKLTESEQKRLNSTLAEAIAKYTALGQVAPKAMTDLEAATRRAEAPTKNLSTQLSQVKSVLGAFGVTLSIGALVGFGNELLRTGDELVKVADRTGLTTEEVQKLQYIAGQSGNSLDDMTGAVSRLQKGLVGGDKNVVSAVENLGLNFKTLKNSNPYSQMEQVAEAMSKIANPAERAKIAIDLFGRAGAEILPTLIANFKQLGDAAPVMSDKTARALDQAGDALATFGAQIKVWAAESFNFAGRLFDLWIKGLYENIATIYKATAAIVDLAAKLPGGAKALDLLGISTANLRQQAQWFTDAAKAEQAQLDHVDTAVRKVVPIMGDYEKATTNAGKASHAAADGASKAAAAVENELKRTTDALGASLKMVELIPPAIHRVKAAILELTNTGDSLIAPLIAWPTEVASQTVKAAASLRESLASTLFTGFSSTLQRAFEGGGDALKSIGSKLGANLTEHIFGKGSGMAALITKHFSGALGEAFNGILPGIGALVGPLINKIAGFFKNIGGPNATEVAGRQTADSFRQELEGTLDWMEKIEVHQLVAQGNNDKWAVTVVAIRDAYLKAGHSVDEALDATNRLWEAEKKGGTAAQTVIDEIITKMHDEIPKAADEAGDAISHAMTGVVESVQEATAAVLTMRDLISQPIDIQVKYAVQNFPNLPSPHVGQGNASQSDIEKFLRENPGDIGRLERAFGNVTDPNLRGYAGGTHGAYPDFGAGTKVMLHGREKITPQGEDAGGGMTFIMQPGAISINGTNKDPQAIADAVMRAIHSGGAVWSQFKRLTLRATGTA